MEPIFKISRKQMPCTIIFIGTPPPFVAKVKDVGDGFDGYMSIDDNPLLQYEHPLKDDFQRWVIGFCRLHRQFNKNHQAS